MTTFRVEKNKDNPFVMISNEMLKDKRMSWKAKGLLAYLLSNDDKWQVYETELEKHSTDGRTSLRSAIKELEELGYIERKQLRSDSGKFKGYEYLVYEQSIHVTKPDNGFSDVGKRDTNNTNSNNTNNNNIITQVSEEFTFSDESTSKISLFKLEFYARFNQPYRKTKRTSFNNEMIKDLDINEFPIYVRMFFDEMDNDINKCTIEYMDKAINRLIR